MINSTDTKKLNFWNQSCAYEIFVYKFSEELTAYDYWNYINQKFYCLK